MLLTAVRFVRVRLAILSGHRQTFGEKNKISEKAECKLDEVDIKTGVIEFID